MNEQCLLCHQNLKPELSIKMILNPFPKPILPACAKCMARFEQLQRGCMQCGKAGHYDDRRCPDCQYWHQKDVDIFNQSLYRYNESMSEYMHQYKFMGDYRLRNIFARQLTQVARKTKRLIVPIPVSEATMKERGFNQVTGFLNVPYCNALKSNKVHHQSHLRRYDRLAMKQPFQLDPAQIDLIKNGDILLVDDVYTTGTTLHLAAAILKKAQVASVNSLTLAR